MNVEEYFRELHQAGSDSLSASLADAEVRDGLSRCMQECLDWHAWKEVQSSLGRDPQVLEWATKELQFGAYLASIGHYRNAFAQIRLFLELGVSSIEFSANEIFRRKWMSGNRNMKWSTLIDEKAGIYAQEFCLVFFKELAGEISIYRGLIDSVYTECSAYVHGGADTHRRIEHKVQFNRDLMLKWLQLRDAAHNGLVFGYVVRFLRELDDAQRAKISPGVLAKLGHLGQIRDCF